MEIRFLDRALRQVEELTPAEERRWRSGIFEAIRQEMQMQGGGLTIREMCESARVSRASYYRSWRKQEPKQEETGPAGCHSATGAERSALWIPANRPMVETRRLGGQSQAGIAADAGRQSVEHPPPPFRRHHRQCPSLARLSESGAADGGQRASISCGWPILPMFDCNRSSSIWP